MSFLEETANSLKRMQDFDVSTLPRTEELGKSLDFTEAVAPTTKLIGLYRRLSVTVLEDFPDDTLKEIKGRADADFSRIKQILDFNTKLANPQDIRTTHIQSIVDAYATSFKSLSQFISYGVSKATDFQRMENEARAMIQSVEDKASGLTEKLQQSKFEADQVLSEIRKTAAEQGVSQQAIYFKEEAEQHTKDANMWKGNANKLAWALGGFALLSMGIHKIPFFKPENPYDSLQLFSSKILIFGVIAYMLVLAARNFLSHKHNSIVNKHRQNALLTFNALTAAASTDGNKDIVLIKAAECVFSPQDTGYAKSASTSGSGGQTIVDVVPKVAKMMANQ
jgi:hypothetical protein